ncbi:MAG: hypothetical protein R3A79_01815 [Nannocystaceae bacterium]
MPAAPPPAPPGRAAAPPSSASSPARRERLARRARTLILAISLAALWAIASAAWSPEPQAAARLVGVALVIAAGVLLFDALLGRIQQRWHGGLRRALVDVGERVQALLQRIWPSDQATTETGDAPLRTGERLALVAGCALTALDVALTTLLLRDVFPEPPYRFAALSAISPELVEWSFYLTVALFKALLELWLGVVDRLRSGEGSAPLRYFVLGLASAFDAALAVARGLLLAEQGITGAAVTTSNIVFVGFGLAIPWVVAHTGGLLVRAADPLLTRFGLLRLLTALPRLLLAGAIWALALAVGLPLLILVAAFGIVATIWSSLHEVVALLLGHDDPEAPAIAYAVDEPSAAPRGDPNPAAGAELRALAAPIGGGR